MRIAHVSDCYPPRLGGIEHQVAGLALRQHLAGHDVEVITSVGSPPDGGPVTVHRPTTLATGSIRYASSRRGAVLAARERYDIVHVHVSTFSPLAFLAARAACHAGVPVAATVHSMWTNMTRLWRWSARTTGWSTWPIAWSAVSHAAAAPVARALGVAAVAVVPNGIDSADWELPARAAEPGRVVLASVMRLAMRKRPRQLLRILARLRAAVPDEIRLEALLIGDGPLRAQLVDDVRRLALGDWVTLTGALTEPQIRQRYPDVDVYVAPATLESFGIAALEARSAGLPIVGRSATGVADFVRDGRHGFLVATDGAMVSALARLVNNPALRDRLAEQSRAEPPDITWPRVLDHCANLYAEALELAGRSMAAVPLR
jgi:glycosyltransferase involved in cell wall biosynthesis